ncbi:MAG: hypothetical protein PHF51_03925 [Candidatus ainarchaeum sp.]|nr:hypothetical protein [Candidatus ainarchaeum sp.]
MDHRAQAAAEPHSAATRRQRGQTAIEFLTTYGWALVLMLAAIAALIALGVLNPGAMAPEACSFPSGFTCYQFLIADNGTLVLDIGQATGKDVALTGIACSAETDPSPESVSLNITSGSHALTCGATCRKSDGTNATQGEYFSGKLVLYYTEKQTGVTHRVEGAIASRPSGTAPDGCT